MFSRYVAIPSGGVPFDRGGRLNTPAPLFHAACLSFLPVCRYGKGQWAATKEKVWVVDDVRAGTAKIVGPLSFVKVDKAGHMVSMCLCDHDLTSKHMQ